eukprot:3055259-Rhodomonas_salina.1
MNQSSTGGLRAGFVASTHRLKTHRISSEYGAAFWSLVPLAEHVALAAGTSASGTLARTQSSLSPLSHHCHSVITAL